METPIGSAVLIFVLSLPAIYGLIAMIMVGIKRYKVRTHFRNGGLASEEILANPKYFSFVTGKNPAQMFSYVIHIILLAGGVLSLFSIYTGAFLLWGFALIALTPATIIANAFWIYPKKTIEAEQYALFTGKASNLLKAERIVAWVTWGAYEAFALFIMGSIAFNFIVTLDGSNYSY